MKRRSNIYKYIYIPYILISVVIHFVFFEFNKKCTVSNNGFAFGFLQDTKLIYVILISVLVVSILVVSLFLCKRETMKYLLIGILILAIGNILDRVLNGVCDYISISSIINFSFPLFNLLDLGIVLSMFFIFIDIMKYGESKHS
jgi:signal peptidase II